MGGSWVVGSQSDADENVGEEVFEELVMILQLLMSSLRCNSEEENCCLSKFRHKHVGCYIIQSQVCKSLLCGERNHISPSHFRGRFLSEFFSTLLIPSLLYILDPINRWLVEAKVVVSREMWTITVIKNKLSKEQSYLELECVTTTRMSQRSETTFK